MADEADIVTEAEAPAETAPEQDVTATPETENLTPEVAEERPAKTFTQEELDAAIAKRLAREERKWKRGQDALPTTTETPRIDIDPEADVEGYAEARADQIVRQRAEAASQAAVLEAYNDRVEAAMDKYDDFEQVAYNPSLKITDVMAETIRASDDGPELIYHLGQNPKEAERISRLSPFIQAKELGKIEANLAANPPVRQTSSAPAPIVPVTPKANGTKVYDTTDPRSTSAMSTSEWIEAERKRQIKRWEQRRSA